jgi:NAD(P)-dependent dehydrogenase (short-subunit alcohol dehydrogenase family)
VTADQPFAAVFNFTSKVHNDTYPEIDSAKVKHDGRYVLIVGASKGIGRQMARSFARAGAAGVAIGARSDLSSTITAIEEVAKAVGKPPPKILPLHLDVASEESVAQAVQKVRENFGHLDFLVNNAGNIESPFLPLAQTHAPDWRDVFTTNVKGPYMVIQAFLPLLLQKGAKVIVNTTSIAANWIFPGSSAYGTSKFALT